MALDHGASLPLWLELAAAMEAERPLDAAGAAYLVDLRQRHRQKTKFIRVLDEAGLRQPPVSLGACRTRSTALAKAGATSASSSRSSSSWRGGYSSMPETARGCLRSARRWHRTDRLGEERAHPGAEARRRIGGEAGGQRGERGAVGAELAPQCRADSA
jgi:hypothetical protein